MEHIRAILLRVFAELEKAYEERQAEKRDPERREINASQESRGYKDENGFKEVDQAHSVDARQV